MIRPDLSVVAMVGRERVNGTVVEISVPQDKPAEFTVRVDSYGPERGSADDLRAIRDAIDECSLSGSPVKAKRAEMALQALSLTDHEGRPVDGAPELVVYTVPVNAFIPETGVARSETDPGEVRVVLYEQAKALRVLARPGWRARLAMIERLLTMALESTGYYAKIATPEGRKAAAVAGGLMTVADALDEVRAMLDGDPAKGNAEAWQKRLAVVEAKLIEWRPAEIPGYLFLPPRDYWSGLDEVMTEIRALIES